LRRTNRPRTPAIKRGSAGLSATAAEMIDQPWIGGEFPAAGPKKLQRKTPS
jgi:hypothetical protein